MRKFLLLALPLAALMFVTGCEGQQASSNASVTTLAPADTTAAAPAPAPQQNYRRTTTQALSGGASYIHDRDLADGPIAAPSAQSEG